MTYIPELKLGTEDTLERERDLRVLSLGAGVQSSTVLFKMLHKEIEPPDVIIFSDTGNEPEQVYEWLEFLKTNINKSGIPFHIVRNEQNLGNIVKDFQAESGRHSLLPLHIKRNDDTLGLAMRTCTSEYKIKPLQKWLREYFDVTYLRSKHIEMVMGISFDELQRVKQAPIKWQVNCYPLVENEITRQQCKDWMKDQGYPPPPRSACIICPFHDAEEWLHIKKTNPKEFDEAVEFDEWLRSPNSTSVGLDKFKKVNTESNAYLYRDRVPLKSVDLEAAVEERHEHSWTLFDDECEGMCGV
jgi:hypothetical protein|tara:strand:+ start:3219 stop:4118 length:900 start_codon:yes stop_codon:yes gene_type:complete